jgi:hypothetical protein
MQRLTVLKRREKLLALSQSCPVRPSSAPLSVTIFPQPSPAGISLKTLEIWQLS